ncbi:histidine kinase N-terminal 7TM domain-containing protein [Halolamina sediminis]|uniref:histidine kinase N-terminal 7TM domain-containing protein n=1 Tax=Halolamina sediminis TaxID=1480675 RepID=UPI0006B5AEE0|nr:histidine kinase N-terminal 7TM domain-containing protein [Halolamina sediminis]
MAFDLFPPWPVLGSIAGGAGALALAWRIRQHRGRPGVGWFLGVFAAQATWCLSYGFGLLVRDPSLRAALEATMWLGIVWTGVTFLGFALEYTGRSDVLRSRLFGAIVGFGIFSTVLVVTNPILGWFWTGFEIDPAFGVATVSYAFSPWAYLVVAVETVLVASAVFLLVDTLLSYGPLYRRESAAVALSSLPPGFALVAWTLEIGAVPQLQLAPLMFVPHLVLDAYAFDRAEMFERNPTTSRAAERTAIDDLADPIIVLSLDQYVVRLNPAAEGVLGVDAESVRDRPLAAFLDLPVGVDEAADGGESEDAPARETVEIDTSDGTGRRTYAVSTSPLTDPSGTRVGYTVVLSDVTVRERQRQRVEVLNRVLRHNLRNDLTVVLGYAETLAGRLDGEEREMVQHIEENARQLSDLGENARQVEAFLDAEETAFDAADLTRSVLRDVFSEAPDATVRTDIADTLPFHGVDRAFAAVVENLVENAIQHGDEPVTVSLTAGDAVARLVVTDAGPGIPEHEVAVLRSGGETALEHGSGLGLWSVHWGVTLLGATVDIDTPADGGTRVEVQFPMDEA